MNCLTSEYIMLLYVTFLWILNVVSLVFFPPVVRLFTALGQPQGKHVETVKISRGGIQQNHRAVSNNMPESCVIVLKKKKPGIGY